jgi:hypothetical protein
VDQARIGNDDAEISAHSFVCHGQNAYQRGILAELDDLFQHEV